MILQETLENINKIDSSILKALIPSYNRGDKNSLGETLRLYNISPKSKIYVDTLKRNEDGKSVHTWKYVTESILENDKVEGIILRSNKRQLLGIFKTESARYSRGKYKLIKSKFFEAIDDGSSGVDSEINTNSDINVRNKMASSVKYFIEKFPNAKKNWDIIIIYKDTTEFGKKEQREKNRAGMEYKPKDKSYQYYIDNLKANLKLRLQKYVNSKVPNFNSIEEIKELIQNKQSINPLKIKICGFVFEKYMLSSDKEYSSNDSYSLLINSIYELKIPGVPSHSIPYELNKVSRLYIYFKIDGLTLKVSDISFRDAKFEEGCEVLLKNQKVLTQGQE